MIYFKVYKGQIPVIEQALEMAGLMLGSDGSGGYVVEMVCADFLTGTNVETGTPSALILSLDRPFVSLPRPKQQEFLSKASGSLDA